MTTKRKPRHVCTQSAIIKEQKEAIAQINLWLAGNHDPENGVIYKMIDVVKDVNEIKSDIAEINTKISEAITGSAIASSSLEKYKIEVRSFEDGKKEALERLEIADNLKKKEVREKWQRVIWIVMASIALIGLGVNIYFNIRGNEKQDTTIQKVNDLGTPVIIDSTGTVINTRASIKMWPNDFSNGFIKKDTIE